MHLTVSAVCLNLLSFGYLAESFVLLTANVEDIKQIAKKFVSESFSDQIAEFLTKAKLQDAISEENERNAQEDRGSREIEEAHDTFKYNEEQRPEERFGSDLQPKIDYENPGERSESYTNIIKDPSNFEKMKEKNELRNKKRLVGKKDKLKIESAYIHQEYNRDLDKVQSHNRYQIKPKSINRVSINPQPEAPIPPASKFGPYKRMVHMTTRKGRDEFDQYDHTGMFNNDLVATSGQVVLPRVRGFNNAMF